MKPYYADERVSVYCADALELLRSLPDASVDLIATDPPYFRVKNEAWDRAWKSEREFLRWIGVLCREWRRVLKPNGSLYVFASPDMAHGVERIVRRTFNVLNVIRWQKEDGWHQKAEKEALRSFLSPWEAVVFAEQRNEVWGDEPDALLKQASAPLAAYIRSERLRAGVTRQQVSAALAGQGLYKNAQTGAAMCSDWEYGDSLPPEPAYRCLQGVLGPGFLVRTFSDVQAEFFALRERFAALRRPFNVAPGSDWSDVWDFRTVAPYPGKHPCEKPLAMMEHIVRTSSRPGDTVLDTFCGSGATAEAARNLGRLAIVADADPHWCGWTARRLSQEVLALEAA